MTDERLRRLEREAANGDAAAAEALYWGMLRTQRADQLLDRMVEAVLTVMHRKVPTVWEKLRWLQGTPPEDMSPELLVARRSKREVYRVASDGVSWERACSMSSKPPTQDFRVFKTLADRNADTGRPGASCLVLENGGVYESSSRHNPYQPHGREWVSVRFERTERKE